MTDTVFVTVFVASTPRRDERNDDEHNRSEEIAPPVPLGSMDEQQWLHEASFINPILLAHGNTTITGT
jgi:hypothetical protein